MLFEAASFVLGLVVGSFLNVVIHRVPRGTFFAGGARSRCPHCGATIRWHDNLPVLSWLRLRGRARCCGEPISLRYPGIEILTAVGFLLVGLAHHERLFAGGRVATEQALWLVFDFYLVGSLIAASAIDLEHRILPDVINYLGIAVGIAAAFAAPAAHRESWLASQAHLTDPAGTALVNAILGCGAGAGSLYLIAVAGKALYRTEAMGLGDVKFMAFAGTFIGPDGVLIALLVACVVGAVVGLVSTLRTGDPLIPFGPFLAAGVLLARFGHAAAMAFLVEDWPRWLRESSWGLPVTFAVSLGCLAVLVYLRRRRRALGPADDDAASHSDS